MIKKLLILLLWGLIVFGFFYFELNQYFTLYRLQTEYHTWQTYINSDASHTVTAMLVFFVIYFVITVTSMPGAAVLTLAAGAFFGFTNGLLIASFASSMGATGAFLVARYLFRESLTAKFPQKLATLNQGIANEGAYYLLTLRLVPLFPFFLINTLMGLTRFPLGKFYAISQLGMLPGTIIFVLAGTQLTEITSISHILSPSTLLILTLIGLFPLLIKMLLAHLASRKRLAAFKRPTQFDYNLVVIGAGAAGLVSSYIAANVKAKVLLIEKHLMGGDCLNHGCVPSKSLIKTAKMAHAFTHSQQHGLLPPTAPFSLTDDGFIALMQSINARIERIAPHDSIERYQSLGVEVALGEAKLLDPWRVQITDSNGEIQIVSCKNIILATGSKPRLLERPGIEKVNPQTTDTLWQSLSARKTAPKHIIIEGAGPIGVELAQSFSRLGIKVTLITKHACVLQSEDIEVRQIALEALHKSKVNVLTSCQTQRYFNLNPINTLPEALPNNLPYGVEIKYQDDNCTTECFDLLIVAIGRTVTFQGLGLEKLGLDPAQPELIQPNQFLQTAFNHIYVAGDAVGKHQFTHIAAHHAWFATVNALFGQFKRFALDESIVPVCTYLDPIIARVGLTEEQAKANKIAYEITRFDLAELDRAITDNQNEGFIKVLTKPKTDVILGVCIVASPADDLLSEFTLAMKYNLGLNKLLRTIHPYPTWGEANKHVAGIWRSQRIKPWQLRILDAYHKWQRKA